MLSLVPGVPVVAAPVVAAPVVAAPVVAAPAGVGPVVVARVAAMSGPVRPVAVSPVTAPSPGVPALPVPCGVRAPRAPPPGVPAPPVSLGETAPAAPAVPAPAAPALPAASLSATAVLFAPPAVACSCGEGGNCEGCLRKTTRRAPAATSRARKPITTNERATVLLMAHSNPARRTSHRGVVQGSPCGEGHARRLRRQPCQACASLVPPAGLDRTVPRPGSPGLARQVRAGGRDLPAADPGACLAAS